MRRKPLGGPQAVPIPMTPARYCYPSPCPKGHPIDAVRRIQWLFAGTSRWRCSICGAVWERPAHDYPPALAGQFPLIFKRLRELNRNGAPFERLRGAMRFWDAFDGEAAG